MADTRSFESSLSRLRLHAPQKKKKGKNADNGASRVSASGQIAERRAAIYAVVYVDDGKTREAAFALG